MPAKKPTPMDKAALLKFDPRPIELVQFDWLPSPIRLRAPSVGDVFRMETITNEVEMIVEMVRLAVVGEDGKPLFTKPEATGWVEDIGAGNLKDLTDKVSDLIGYKDFPQDETGEKDEGN